MLLILGAAGQVGTPLIQRLSRIGVPARAVVRTDASAERISLPGIEPVVVDFTSPDTLAEHMRDVSRLFLLTPGAPDQTEVQNNLVDLARRCDVKSVVKLSVYSAGEDAACALSRWHWRNDEYLKASGLDWTILYPHTFMQSIALQFADSIRKFDHMAAAVGPSKTISMVDMRDVADVAAAVLTSDGHSGREYLITGPEALTYADCARKLSSALGRTISYSQITANQARKTFGSAGLPAWLSDALVDLFAMYDTGQLNPISDVTETVAGHAPRSFDDFLADNLALFR
jgi:NAD(P)H dehydrogenase (quinone)